MGNILNSFDFIKKKKKNVNSFTKNVIALARLTKHETKTLNQLMGETILKKMIIKRGSGRNEPGLPSKILMTIKASLNKNHIPDRQSQVNDAMRASLSRIFDKDDPHTPEAAALSVLLGKLRQLSFSFRVYVTSSRAASCHTRQNR